MNSSPLSPVALRSIKILFTVLFLAPVFTIPVFFQDAFAASRFENKGAVVVGAHFSDPRAEFVTLRSGAMVRTPAH